MPSPSVSDVAKSPSLVKSNIPEVSLRKGEKRERGRGRFGRVRRMNFRWREERREEGRERRYKIG